MNKKKAKSIHKNTIANTQYKDDYWFFLLDIYILYNVNASLFSMKYTDNLSLSVSLLPSLYRSFVHAGIKFVSEFHHKIKRTRL